MRVSLTDHARMVRARLMRKIYPYIGELEEIRIDLGTALASAQTRARDLERHMRMQREETEKARREAQTWHDKYNAAEQHLTAANIDALSNAYQERDRALRRVDDLLLQMEKIDKEHEQWNAHLVAEYQKIGDERDQWNAEKKRMEKWEKEFRFFAEKMANLAELDVSSDDSENYSFREYLKRDVEVVQRTIAALSRK